MSNQTIRAGLDWVSVGLLDEDGWNIGGTAAGPTAGTQLLVPMRRLKGAKTAELPVPDPQVVTATGDNKPLAQFVFPANTLPAGAVTAAISDLDLEALLQRSLVETFGNQRIGVLASENISFVNMCMILQGPARDGDDPTIEEWAGYYVLTGNMVPVGDDGYTEVTVGTDRYYITTNPARRKLWGATLSAVDNGTLRAAIMRFKNPYPIQVEVGLGNGTEDTFIVNRDIPNATEVQVLLNGVPQAQPADFTVDIGDREIDFTSPPGNGVRIHVAYGFVPTVES